MLTDHICLSMSIVIIIGVLGDSNSNSVWKLKEKDVCARFIAIDVTDHKHLRVKEIMCFAAFGQDNDLDRISDKSQTVLLKEAW